MQFIHTEIVENQSSWLLTGVYVRPHCSLKTNFWNELFQMSQNVDLAWVVLGDFNDIASLDEKSGGTRFLTNRARSFVDRFEACNLLDMGSGGSKFTWVRREHGRVVLRERLDRVLANSEAKFAFPEARVINLTCLSSDHHPILFNSELTPSP